MDKYEEAGRIEAGLSLPAEVVEPMLAYVKAMDAQRGDWVNLRNSNQPEPPWPAEDNPVFRYLLQKAKVSLDAGMDPMVAVLQAAAHAWFEGGIENYDRGQQDARKPRSMG